MNSQKVPTFCSSINIYMWKLSGNAQSDGLSNSRRTGNDVNVEEEKKKAIEEMWKNTADAQSINKQRSY